ncbi:syntaxin-like [Liolophura sinensis]|uniref:syntaxin-like n=1 Tax=Liolophura sinensis TaxID=3198878 RepID=UPI0031590135
MVKDRLADLKARRPSVFRSIKESIRRKSFRRKNTMGNFLEDVNDIDGALVSLKDSIQETKRLQASVLSTPASNKKLHTELAKSNAQNRELSANVRKLIQDLRQNYDDPAGKNSTDKSKASEQVVRNQLERLTSDLKETVNDWHTAQASYGDRVKERLKREYSIVGESKSDKELNDLLNSDEPHSVFTQDVIKEIQDAQNVLDQVKEREKEIRNLEKSVVEVHELFTDIQILVGEQGEVIDRVETNVENAHENVAAGAAKLKQARVYKKKARRKKFIIAGIVIVAVLLVGGIIAIAILA